jgi:hypothetical protein
MPGFADRQRQVGVAWTMTQRVVCNVAVSDRGSAGTPRLRGDVHKVVGKLCLCPALHVALRHCGAVTEARILCMAAKESPYCSWKIGHAYPIHFSNGRLPTRGWQVSSVALQ